MDIETTPVPGQTSHVWAYPPPPPAGALAKKMVAAMGSIEAVTKSGTNQKQGYKYVKAADIANEVRNVLVTHGIAFFYSVAAVERWEVPTNSGGKMLFCQLVIEATFQDMDSGEEMVVQGVGWGADSLEKAPYKAMTGALKYVLRMTFLIPDEDDPENEKPDSRSANPPVGRPAVNQTPAKGAEAPRPGDRKPASAAQSAPAPSDPSSASQPPVGAATQRDAKQKTAHNARIRELQAAADETKVKEYIIANVGPDYRNESYEKWESVLQKMEAAKTAGTLAGLVGA